MIAGSLSVGPLREQARGSSGAIATFYLRMGRATILFCIVLLLSILAASGALAHAPAPLFDVHHRSDVDPASDENRADADCCQPAGFHGSCMQSGYSGHPAVEMKLAPRDSLALVFPRRLNRLLEGRSTAPDPAPPRPASV